MPKYKYTGNGIMTFYVDDKRYTVSYKNREVELPKKANIAGMELVDESRSKKNKGDE